jgi:alpha-tubulin suppressor-like RCC1 family protein
LGLWKVCFCFIFVSFGKLNNFISFGRLGHGHERDRFSPLLVSALKGIKIIQVSCGDFHTAALSDRGEMFTWGKGSDGRLGHGSESNESQPRLVQSLSEIGIAYIACGYVTTAAISSISFSFVIY